MSEHAIHKKSDENTQSTFLRKAKVLISLFLL